MANSVDFTYREAIRRLGVFTDSAQTWLAGAAIPPHRRRLARIEIDRFSRSTAVEVAEVARASRDGWQTECEAMVATIHREMHSLADHVRPVIDAGDQFDGLAVTCIGLWARDFLTAVDDVASSAPSTAVPS